MSTKVPPEIKIDPARLMRAIHLDATPIDIATFRVTGGSQDHTVEIRDGEVYCDCTDASVRGRGCKHELCVKLNALDPDVVKALRTVIPKGSRDAALAPSNVTDTIARP